MKKTMILLMSLRFIKVNCALIITIVVSSSVLGQAPPIAWQKSLGGSDFDRAFDVKQTFDGGYIVCGDVNSNNGDVSGNHGNTDAWVVKLDNNGIIQWQKAMGGGSGTESFRSVQQTIDGGYILLGSTSSNDGDVSGYRGGEADYWLVKLASTGAMEWQKCMGGSLSDDGYCVQLTTDGGYILTGVTSSVNGDVFANQGIPGTKDVWIVKTNNIGAIIWQKNYGTTGNDQSAFISQTLDGGYIVAAGGDRNDGDLLCTMHGGNDSWILKLDNGGNIVWQKCLGGPGSDSPNCIRENTDGTIMVLSFTNSEGGDVNGWHDPGGLSFPTDYWVVKLSSTGSLIWQKCLGGTSGDYPSYSLRQTPDGGYIVGGWSSSINGDVTGLHGGEDYWIVKLNATGAIQWQQCYGGTSVDNLLSIQTTADGGYIMAGSSFSNDGDVSGNHGSYDLWVVKLGSNIPLPVNLLKFEANKLNNKVQLHWQTSSEQNSSHFNIERSTDGRQFASIGKVISFGNSQTKQNYYLTDATPFYGENYYRLKQVDNDGRFTYSAVLRISNDESLIFSLSPNPAGHFINITFPGKREMLTINIYDAKGRLLKQQKQKNELAISVEIKQLEAGIYFIQLSDGETTQKAKFVKQ